MSKINFTSESLSVRFGEIENDLNNPKSNMVVNDRLELSKRDNSFVRLIKIIILPVAYFFGWDPFCHTRIHRVATILMSQYQKHEKSLSSEDKERLGRILTRLNNKTHRRYGLIIGIFIYAITGKPPKPTTPPPAPPLPPAPIKIGSSRPKVTAADLSKVTLKRTTQNPQKNSSNQPKGTGGIGDLASQAAAGRSTLRKGNTKENKENIKQEEPKQTTDFRGTLKKTGRKLV